MGGDAQTGSGNAAGAAAASATSKGK
jgi:hypothetical protein